MDGKDTSEEAEEITFVKSIQGGAGATIGPDLTEAQHSWWVMLEFMTNHSKVLHFLWHSFCSEKGQPCLSAMQLLVLKKVKCLRRHCFQAPLGGGIVLARKPSVPTGIEWQGFIGSYRQMWVKCDKTWKSEKILEIKVCCTCSCYGSVRILQRGERDGQTAVCTAKNEIQIWALISKRILQNNVSLGLG